ncbi:hypothetical protein ETR_02899 [Erwinia tracheiphila PSU-1]|nr:hypothetical protein ETR_02899 [Erwinia tracheiphila PSU-1]
MYVNHLMTQYGYLALFIGCLAEGETFTVRRRGTSGAAPLWRSGADDQTRRHSGGHCPVFLLDVIMTRPS